MWPSTLMPAFPIDGEPALTPSMWLEMVFRFRIRIADRRIDNRRACFTLRERESLVRWQTDCQALAQHSLILIANRLLTVRSSLFAASAQQLWAMGYRSSRDYVVEVGAVVKYRFCCWPVACRAPVKHWVLCLSGLSIGPRMASTPCDCIDPCRIPLLLRGRRTGREAATDRLDASRQDVITF